MKLKSLRFELETDRGTTLEIYLDGDGEVIEVDLSSGEFWPEDLTEASASIEVWWSRLCPTSNAP